MKEGKVVRGLATLGDRVFHGIHRIPSGQIYKPIDWEPGSENYQETLAKEGARYFARASSEVPASATAQAALIAQYCLRENNQPLILMDCLLKNPDEVYKLANAANSAHRTNHVGKTGPINASDIIRIAVADFIFADAMMLLSFEELQRISSTLYSSYVRHSSDKSISEDHIRAKARSQIANLDKRALEKFNNNKYLMQANTYYRSFLTN